MSSSQHAEVGTGRQTFPSRQSRKLPSSGATKAWRLSSKQLVEPESLTPRQFRVWKVGSLTPAHVRIPRVQRLNLSNSRTPEQSSETVLALDIFPGPRDFPKTFDLTPYVRRSDFLELTEGHPCRPYPKLCEAQSKTDKMEVVMSLQAVSSGPR